MKKNIAFLLILTIFLSACRPQPSALIGSWSLVSYGTAQSMTAVDPDAGARLTFSQDGTFFGSGGCNSLSGEYSVHDNQITFRNLTATLMACDDVRMQQEGAVFQALSGTVQFETQSQELTIAGNDVVLRFTSVPVE